MGQTLKVYSDEAAEERGEVPFVLLCTLIGCKSTGKTYVLPATPREHSMGS